MENEIKLNFVCIGAQKAGTTSLHEILNQHPNIELPTNKEASFFIDDSKFKKGLEHYFKFYFNPKSTSSIFGEINPEFSHLPKIANRIKNSFGEIKIIMLIRNPVDRAFSHYLMTKRRGLEPLSFKEALLSEKGRLETEYGNLHHSYISRGNYVNQIKKYENLFGEENMKVILFDDFVKSTSKVISKICEFIEVKQYDFDFSIKSNVASESRSKLLRDFLYRPNSIKKILGKLLITQKGRDKVALTLDRLNLKKAEKESLNSELKQEVYNQFFKTEMDNLEKLLNIDLSSWKTF